VEGAGRLVGIVVGGVVQGAECAAGVGLVDWWAVSGGFCACGWVVPVLLSVELRRQRGHG
jgi:hypothetical protein